MPEATHPHLVLYCCRVASPRALVLYCCRIPSPRLLRLYCRRLASPCALRCGCQGLQASAARTTTTSSRGLEGKHTKCKPRTDISDAKTANSRARRQDQKGRASTSQPGGQENRLVLRRSMALGERRFAQTRKLSQGCSKHMRRTRSFAFCKNHCDIWWSSGDPEKLSKPSWGRGGQGSVGLNTRPPVQLVSACLEFILGHAVHVVVVG
jgi:hypothetical protein